MVPDDVEDRLNAALSPRALGIKERGRRVGKPLALASTRFRLRQSCHLILTYNHHTCAGVTCLDGVDLLQSGSRADNGAVVRCSDL